MSESGGTDASGSSSWLALDGTAAGPGDLLERRLGGLVQQANSLRGAALFLFCQRGAGARSHGYLLDGAGVPADAPGHRSRGGIGARGRRGPSTA